MRKIILHVAVTLDGFIESPNGEIDWLVRDEKTDCRGWYCFITT